MKLTSAIVSGGLHGELTPPGDKSISHRALIFSSLAEGRSRIGGLLMSADTRATLAACRQLGAQIESENGRTRVDGTAGHLQRPPGGLLDLGNSGTAMRLLAGVLCAQSFATTLTGDASLNRRPMRRIVEPLTRMGAGISASGEGTAPLEIVPVGGLRGIEYDSPVASAQVKSCVLLAGLFASGRTCVREPRLSRDHTERMLPLFGVDLPAAGCVNGGARLRPADFDVPGDISSAVFALAAAALVPGSAVVVRNVGLNPTRTGFLTCLEEMGATLNITAVRDRETEPVGDVEVVYSGRLKAIDVPPERVPDMIDELPLLMALAATATGVTRIRGAGELRIKESDRLAVMAAGLRALGVELKEYDEGMDIQGGQLRGGSVDSAADHRCAMSFAVLGLIAAPRVEVSGAEYIATSYPGFAHDVNQLGGDMHTGDPP